MPSQVGPLLCATGTFFLFLYEGIHCDAAEISSLAFPGLGCLLEALLLALEQTRVITCNIQSARSVRKPGLRCSLTCVIP